MAWFADTKALLKAKLKRLKKKQKKKDKLRKRRKLYIILAHMLSHKKETARRRAADDNLRAGARSRGRARTRERGSPDKRLKHTAQEEQLWKLRSMTQREKTRHRKQEALNRWTMTATSGGMFRGR